MQIKNPISPRRLVYAILTSILLSLTAWAQIKSSTITGTVTDSTGAVIPGANVTVINQETNVAMTTVTDESGNFTVPYLAPGIYNVNVEKSGSGFARAGPSLVGISKIALGTVGLDDSSRRKGTFDS